MIKGIIPKWGRTSRYALQRLASVSGQNLDDAIELIKRSKDLFSLDYRTAQQHLDEGRGNSSASLFSLSMDRKRDPNPYRIGLLALELNIAGVPVQIQGDEPHIGSTLIRSDEADIVFTGLDELLIHNQHYLKHHRKKVTNFGNYNYQLESPTGVIVSGSANLITSNGLQDFLGMFLMGNRADKQKGMDDLIAAGVPIYVKGRYEGIVISLFPKVKTVSVQNVEDAVRETPTSYGFELVQTGKSIVEKGLVVYGKPLFVTETLVVVNYGHFQKNPDLAKVARALNPQGFYDQERVLSLAHWAHQLNNNLGDSWVNKPVAADLFVTSQDIEDGVRPYNLDSRGWKSSDTLPPAQANAQNAYISQRRNEFDDAYLANLSGGVSVAEINQRVNGVLRQPELLRTILEGK